VRFEHVADAVAVWRVDHLDALRRIEGEHGLTWEAIEARFHYKNRPGVQVVAARVRRLAAPAVIPEARRYGGCVSWVELDDPVDVAGAEPVLPDDVLADRVLALSAALGPPDIGGVASRGPR
jgi:hypothetical protein